MTDRLDAYYGAAMTDEPTEAEAPGKRLADAHDSERPSPLQRLALGYADNARNLEETHDDN